MRYETLGGFTEMMENFSRLGKWRTFRVGSQDSNAVLKSTLSGPLGKVEVWGGTLHRRKVWVIGRDKSEKLVAEGCYGDGLRRAVEDACRLAGIQERLPI